MKINKIYENYFQIIEDNYGRYFNGENPEIVINSLLKKPMTSRILYQTTDTIVNEIVELLSINNNEMMQDICSLAGLKSNFTGNSMPQDSEKFLCKSGLYVDTLIVSDPLTFIQSTKQKMSNKYEFSRSLFISAFNMLKIKDAFINDLHSPMVRMIPRPIFLRSLKKDTLEAQIKTILYFNELFDSNFSSIEELEKFIYKIKSVNYLIKEIKSPEILIPDITEKGDIKKGLENFYSIIKYYGFPVTTVSEALYLNVKGSMLSNISHLNFSKDYHLINSYESPNPWHYFNWMIKNETKKIDKRLFVMNSITLDKVKWFGNLKLNDVIRIRQNSCLQDFRDILNKEINYIDEDNIDQIPKQIEYNLINAFKEHQKELKKIESNFNLSYWGSSTAIIGGTISILNGIFTNNAISSLAGSAALIGSTIKWIKSNIDYNEKKNLINSPIGILFNTENTKHER